MAQASPEEMQQRITQMFPQVGQAQQMLGQWFKAGQAKALLSKDRSKGILTVEVAAATPEVKEYLLDSITMTIEYLAKTVGFEVYKGT